MGSLDKLVRILDENVSAWVEFSFMYLMLFGFKHGIFKLTQTKTDLSRLEDLFPETSRTILERAIEAYSKLGVLERDRDEIKLSPSPPIPDIPWDRLDMLFSDWVPVLEEVYRMADYALLSKTHPRMIMDFDRGADFWDMRLSQSINTIYRDIIARLGDLKDGKSVLDLGCGSVSPVELGRRVGPNGIYVGVDFSVGMLSIARERIREEGMDWVELRNMDIRTMLPSRRYDAVVMSFILEYLEDKEAAVRKALKFLDEGGKLIIVEPFREEHPHIEAWEFFEGFTPEFTEFPEKATIRNVAEEEEVKYRELGKNIIVMSV